MTDSFDFDNYSIVSSLSERTIYIKLIDKTLYMCYESNVDAKELRLSIELNNTYQLITKCFRKESGYSIGLNISSGVMRIQFNALVEGFLKINFEIILREKVMSNDGQLTMNFHRIEQKQDSEIKMLTKRIMQLEWLADAISYAEIFMLKSGYANQHNNNQLYWKINTTELSLHSSYWDFSKIKLFYQLEKLSFNSCPELSTFKNCQISNNTVKEISLTSNNAISSLDGLNAFPKLEKLIMNSCPNCGSTIVQVLNSYKHKIKHLDIKSCSAVNNTELMTYCQKNNIKLDLA
jgi:hypothetical protein